MSPPPSIRAGTEMYWRVLQGMVNMRTRAITLDAYIDRCMKAISAAADPAAPLPRAAHLVFDNIVCELDAAGRTDHADALVAKIEAELAERGLPHDIDIVRLHIMDACRRRDFERLVRDVHAELKDLVDNSLTEGCVARGGGGRVGMVYDVVREYGLGLVQGGWLDSARNHFRAWLEHCEARLGPGHRSALALAASLGECFVRSGFPEMGESLLLRATGSAATPPGVRRDALRALVACLVAQGRHSDAAAVQDELFEACICNQTEAARLARKRQPQTEGAPGHGRPPAKRGREQQLAAVSA